MEELREQGGRSSVVQLCVVLALILSACSSSRYEVREASEGPRIIKGATGTVVVDSRGEPLQVAVVEEEMGSGNRIRRLIVLVPFLGVSGFLLGLAFGTILDPPGECRECIFNISDGQGYGMIFGFFGGISLGVYGALTVGKKKDFDDAVDKVLKSQERQVR